ncbi:hypothetical protein J6590_056467 [Homalodisca vitripennis]|nr:hypothetical protein J6590_056467 [Homalodisca vitripennis]
MSHGNNDIDQYNTFKYLTFGEPELSRCHWHCPFEATRLCACDPRQRLHRLFLNPCFMHLHNSCFGTEFMPLSGLSKCHEKYSYPERELEILKMTLDGFGQKIKQPLYGRVYVLIQIKLTV